MMFKRMLLCLLVLLLCAPVLAEEVVELPDAVVTYTPPEGFYRLTRESSASAFNKLGLSQRSFLRWMEQNDCYTIWRREPRSCCIWRRRRTCRWMR